MKNNQPKNDVWMLKDSNAESLNYEEIYKFDFSYVSSEEIKEVLKVYVWMNYKTKNKTTQSLYAEILKFKHFNDFAVNRNITRLIDLTEEDIADFVSYLKTNISELTKKPFAFQYQKKLLTVIKSIIYWCQAQNPATVPDKEIFTDNEYTGVNRKLEIEYIPDDVLAQINNALIKEENPYIKYGVVILESTGMRLGELLKLSIHCIKPHLISGYTISGFEQKKRKERPPMPVSNECVVAVEKLLECTRELRAQANESMKDLLYIDTIKRANKYENNIGEIGVVKYSTLKWWFQCFIRENKIMNSKGELYNLTYHQFKRTLGMDMLSEVKNIKVIQDVLGDKNLLNTKPVTADKKDKESDRKFKGIRILRNINQIDASIIDNPVELEWFRANNDKCITGLSDGYCTKPSKNGEICDRLLKRKKCYTCSGYITTPEYLEAHKNHLNVLEKQLKYNIYGDHYVEHFMPTMEVLKAIISKLEDMRDGRY